MDKQEILGSKLITELTPYEKFLMLPKIVKAKINDTELEFYFDIHFGTKYNEDCSIEYNRVDIFGDYETLKGLYWFGSFEECVNKAYQYFREKDELLKNDDIRY